MREVIINVRRNIFMPCVPISSSSKVAAQSVVVIALVLISSSRSITSGAYHISQLMGITLLDPNSR